jgi:NADH:ubiquinone oxidoreductase subunit F (NADH-binding)/NADH:ubiquinone oxidoreductase subunit E
MSHNLNTLALRKGRPGPSLIDRLREVLARQGALSPDDLRTVARETGLPEATVAGVASFYSDLSVARGRERVRVCVGTACFAASGGRHVAAIERAMGLTLGQVSPDGAKSLEPVYCLGQCHEGPAALTEGPARTERTAFVDSSTGQGAASAAPQLYALCEAPIVLRNLVGRTAAANLAEARRRGVWDAYLATKRDAAGPKVLAEVLASGLRGRGGAGFPCGEKWRFVAAQPAGEKFIVCNADEGDPGGYVDRVLLEGDPHSVLEGMALGGLAVGASQGRVYVRSEYPEALSSLRRAADEARAAGLLGPGFDVQVAEGAGAYVCGEETALLRSLEGLRGTVSARPPYPAVKGLFERPTAVNNVETLLNVPWIVARGGAAFQRRGLNQSRGTKAVSLNERFVRPGVYEVELGMPLRELCDRAGGLRGGRRIKALQVGGPLAGLVPEHLLGTRLGFEELEQVGALLGHGGVVAFDETTDMGALALHLFEFGDAESCGKCFPCRLGMRRGLELVRGLREGKPLSPDTAGLLTELCQTMRLGSLCGHGAGLPLALSSILKHFPDELLSPRRGAAQP